MKKEEIKYWIWFSRLKEIGCVKKKKLLEKYKTPIEISKLNEENLKECGILDEKNIKYIFNQEYKQNLEKYEEYMEKNKIDIITIFDEMYPERLRQIYDSPIVLFAKGNLELLKDGGIAIVGARNCSNYGKNTAQEIAYNIAQNNKCIISGLAKGIDKYAHTGALNAKGKTIAVIGNGLDDIYPGENKILANNIIEKGGLIISEYVIGTKPEKMNFPERNRIISALSDGIVVVEAREKSGALITADFGLEHGKEIFAIPGNINSFNSVGTNELIKQGANIVTDYKDVLDVCYNNYNY